MRSFVVFLLLALGWADAARAETLRIGGTGAGLELSRILVGEFARRRPGVEPWIPDSLGTSGGIKALAAGRLDLALLMRPLKDNEVEQGKAVVLCRTPWVFYTHATRSDVALTRADLPGLYLSNLPPFARGEVRPLLRPANESGFQVLQDRFPELRPAIEAARQNRAAVEAITDQEAMTEVERGSALVGFGALAPVFAEKRKLRAASFDGRDPSSLTAEYPLWATLYLAYAGAGQGSLVADFLDFVRSPAPR